MGNPTASMLVIGDEILSGRTRDANMHFLAQQLTSAGIDLCEVRVVSDDRSAIVNAVNGLREQFDYVFTSGGIGPTHDDITAGCIAEAFGVGIDVRADARAVLATNYPNGEADLTEARLRMARIPDGADLIDNPVSKAPGFSIGNVHVMAGVPRIFAAMVEGLLPKLAGGAPVVSETVKVLLAESAIAPKLETVVASFPALSLGSYPFETEGRHGANLVVRGSDQTAVAMAADQLRDVFAEVLG